MDSSILNIVSTIQSKVSGIIKTKLGEDIDASKILVNQTSKAFDGDFTVVLFPLVKILRQSPDKLGLLIGDNLVNEDSSLFTEYGIVKGFLNFTLKPETWNSLISSLYDNRASYGKGEPTGQISLVEFASPNTNKPIHLGHVRNILLGWSISKIYKEAGHTVYNTQIVNDRGIAICKSMLAWQKNGKGTTPQSEGIKGDHFVGNYYVSFNKMFSEEYQHWQKSEIAQELLSTKKEGQSDDEFFAYYKNQYFNTHSEIGAETKEMLIKWESNDTEVKDLWQKMNAWVYEGFDQTFKALGVDFDKTYYESNTYLTGKRIVNERIKDNTFYKKEDGSIWVDLEDVGMDQKLILRSDGTSVYITQDIGTAKERYEDYNMDSCVYVVGNEQDYHFKALFETLKKMNEPFAEKLYHLSYGMVELPTGKMKSREGTVVDADDLIEEVITEAGNSATESGNLEGLDSVTQNEIFRRIGMGALKYFMIRTQPKKQMVFDPKQSVDMQGQTGPYIQNAYVRIQSIIRKSEVENYTKSGEYLSLEPSEKNLTQQILLFPDVIQQAAKQLDPSEVANYCYALAKDFHRFYHEVRILNAAEEAQHFRLKLIETVAVILERSMELLGIQMPERM